ncbi:MAG: GTP-binding protein [Saprospiraceae bacterium]|nr:GTP-binding protein [Saprospiraceae bacterium]
MQRIPVQLITGFLGAGKTTFLNHLIKQRANERLFVIENEVGKINVDCELVMNGEEDIAGLTAGCLCCSLHDKLLDVLEEVSQRREEYDRLVIETTGVADPTSIIQTFLGNRMVEKVFDLQQVICLADAAYVVENINATDEARRQLVSADVVLLNKCDQVTAAEVEQLVQTLKNIHPTATLFVGQNGMFPIDEIMEVKPFHDERTNHIASEVPNGEHRHNDITTFTLTFDRPFNLDSLAYDLVKLARLYRHQVYRIKGIIAVDRTPTRVVIQSVRDSFVLTDGPLWEPSSERISHIVFIGKDVKREVIERMLGRHLVKPGIVRKS